MAIPELLKTIALNRLVDKGVQRIDRFYGTDTEREEDEDKGFGFVSQQRPGGLGSIIGRALAYSLLGPIAGPLAFAAGRGILSKQQQGLGFNPFDFDSGSDSSGIDQKELQKGIQAALDDTDPEDVGISARDAAIAAGIQAAEDDNGDSGGDSGGSFDGASSMDDYSSDPTGYSGSFRYGGLASLYR
tara:strand:+ start:37 stop:597 length:561 start_codon:yes stop_codon:yes gene_type:complete